ncbi:cytochrome C assembly family protein [Neorickettsia helminthoeca str. Oregon]|uniref:Cytochrome C assembly family protein n=1 Tax=Neorickettsia helminthoeca str. Oregon TaxID=1286528 RepID=X5GWV4_9RICK|nr:cytochrome c biogenesis protein CcsA [Neorickettsia helminthoeca]AHX11492.1 cytochrome C assembly family protein [Neorickettsia helminthoeca str. Oregon]
MISIPHHYIGTTLLYLSLLSSLFRRVNISLFLNSIIFLTLFHAYISDNFLLQNVYLSSHANLPFYYKIIASWTTHEGSMILWIWSLSLYLFLFSKFYRTSQIRQLVITTQSYVLSIFLVFIIYSGNPFKKVILSSTNGLGLNPILQDLALMIHPPILYLGYVGTSICFSIAIAILLSSRSREEEFKILNHFLLVAFTFLTLGIGLGGWWSYRELGWGGFWSWDPVENVSLMPWLLLLGALHSSFLSAKRGLFKGLSIILSILGFIASICGTFITRTGMTESLHTFNTNAESGVYLLIITLVLFVTSMWILITRHRSLYAAEPKDIRFSGNMVAHFILIQNILCILLFVVIFTATILPAASKLLGYDAMYIDQSFYNSIFGQIGAILGICLSLFIGLKSYKKLYLEFIILILLASLLSLGNFNNTLTAFLSFSGMLTILSVSVSYIRNLKKEVRITAIATNKMNSSFLTHLGFGLLLYSIAGFASHSAEVKKYFKPGDQITIKTYNIGLKEYSKIDNLLFTGIRGVFTVNQTGRLEPEFRFYKQEKTLNTESATIHYLLDDVQVVISGVDEKFGLAVEIYYKEKIQLIWLSLIIILFGVLYKICDP